MSAWIVPDSPLLLAVTAVTHTSRHPGNKTDNTFAAQALELSGGGRLLGNVVDCSWSPVAASTERERGNSTFVIFIHSMPFPNAYKCDKDAIGSTEIPVWPVGLLEWNQCPIVSKNNMCFRCVFFNALFHLLVVTNSSVMQPLRQGSEFELHDDRRVVWLN